MFGTGTKTRLLLYGAYGFRGRLTVELAAAKKARRCSRGPQQRSPSRVGRSAGLPTRVVGLNDHGQPSEALKDIACVAHMAGPFANTSAPMLSACLARQTNYIDITGEIEVFEAMWSRKGEIRAALELPRCPELALMWFRRPPRRHRDMFLPQVLSRVPSGRAGQHRTGAPKAID
jgi:hypothetical protein